MPKKRGTEIQLARGRLKGVLQDLVAPSDEEEMSEESENTYQPPAPARGRPPKRVKRESPEPEPNSIHQSYVMKLFDRSLDLAKYRENTSLYPICRAWMTNQPRSAEIKKNARTPSPEIRLKNDDLLKQLANGTITEITSMPQPKALDIPRVPSPLPEQKSSSKDNISLNYDINAPTMSLDEIMSEHKVRWTNVRKKWQMHSKSLQQRYILSYELLDGIYRE